MQVQLRNNVFTATQWFKDGDHPRERVNPATKQREIEHAHSFVETRHITPGQWIVEIFGEIHRYDDVEFRQMFEPVDVKPPTICKARTE